MYFIGIGLLLFGFLIIIQPAFLAYIVAGFFIIMGTHILAIVFHISQLKKENQERREGSIFSFGGYEIIKKRK